MKFKNIALITGLLFVAGVFAWYSLRHPRFVAGDTVPDFAFSLPTGNTVQFSDLRGKFVLIQFWGSWCGPCRAENPHIFDLYKKYRGNGFEVLSIGIEQNPRAWQRAIENDSMKWNYHTIESQDFNGPLAQRFNIHSIPATYLVDDKGIILGVNLRPAEMDRILTARFDRI